MNKSTYDGLEKIYMGNGESISHIGETFCTLHIHHVLSIFETFGTLVQQL